MIREGAHGHSADIVFMVYSEFYAENPKLNEVGNMSVVTVPIIYIYN